MATPTKKPAVKKVAGDKPAVKKPRAVKSEAAVHHEKKPEHTPKEEVKAEHKEHESKAAKAAPAHHKDGRYTWAVGRRKTAVANVRLFSGTGKSTVNKKDILNYFSNNQDYVDIALKPMQLTGTEKDLYVYVNMAGGGIHSQAEALAHGIARAIAKATPDFHKVLKKNGFLTRDSRMKERKKPGLKRARRGPQWAKR